MRTRRTRPRRRAGGRAGAASRRHRPGAGGEAGPRRPRGRRRAQVPSAAAVFERLSGGDWGLVGDALGLSTHDASAGFALAEARFLAELRAADGLGPPRVFGELSWWRAYLVREPWEAARDLDEWVVRHRDGDVDHGAAPVSGALLRARGLDDTSDPS
ncbi:hypothetical protein [Streptomyces sp. 8K308]|uniref:hypothetical protein n=1 Tax=Streptomyces sp. 8K308 TaxID=2530388 RepID=UPI001FB5D2FF|nr:hypothetical protein [Streptomyces sp. 8K308]